MKHEVLTEINLKLIDVVLFRLGKFKWEVNSNLAQNKNFIVKIKKITQQLKYRQMKWLCISTGEFIPLLVVLSILIYSSTSKMTSDCDKGEVAQIPPCLYKVAPFYCNFC
jgi:hypothetical protein